MTYEIQPAGSHYIDGAYVEDTAGAEIPVIYAATGERIATLRPATPAIVEHDKPAHAGAWRLEALLEVDRQLLQTSGEGRRRGIDKGTA